MVVCPTVREADGLAMSSRNRYLNEYERQIAPKLQQALANCQQNIKSGVAVGQALEIGTDQLTNAGFKMDYFSMVELPTMEPLLAVTNSIGKSALITAAALGNTRLLDNVVW
jgi:pantoate--beta-alanine ligase